MHEDWPLAMSPILEIKLGHSFDPIQSVFLHARIEPSDLSRHPSSDGSSAGVRYVQAHFAEVAEQLSPVFGLHWFVWLGMLYPNSKCFPISPRTAVR